MGDVSDTGQYLEKMTLSNVWRQWYRAVFREKDTVRSVTSVIQGSIQRKWHCQMCDISDTGEYSEKMTLSDVWRQWCRRVFRENDSQMCDVSDTGQYLEKMTLSDVWRQWYRAVFGENDPVRCVTLVIQGSIQRKWHCQMCDVSDTGVIQGSIQNKWHCQMCDVSDSGEYLEKMTTAIQLPHYSCILIQSVPGYYVGLHFVLVVFASSALCLERKHGAGKMS